MVEIAAGEPEKSDPENHPKRGKKLKLSDTHSDLAQRVAEVQRRVDQLVQRREGFLAPENLLLISNITQELRRRLRLTTEPKEAVIEPGSSDDFPLRAEISRETRLDALLLSLRGEIYRSGADINLAAQAATLRWARSDRKTLGRIIAAIQRTGLLTLGHLIDHFTIEGESGRQRFNVALLLHFFSMTQKSRAGLAHTRCYGEYNLSAAEMQYLPSTAEAVIKALLHFGIITPDLYWNEKLVKAAPPNTE